VLTGKGGGKEKKKRVGSFRDSSLYMGGGGARGEGFTSRLIFFAFYREKKRKKRKREGRKKRASAFGKGGKQMLNLLISGRVTQSVSFDDRIRGGRGGKKKRKGKNVRMRSGTSSFASKITEGKKKGKIKGKQEIGGRVSFRPTLSHISLHLESLSSSEALEKGGGERETKGGDRGALQSEQLAPRTTYVPSPSVMILPRGGKKEGSALSRLLSYHLQLSSRAASNRKKEEEKGKRRRNAYRRSNTTTS